MKNLYALFLSSLLLAAGAVCNPIKAEHLTPDEALRRVESSHSARRVPALQASSHMSLAFTQYERASQESAVYVFNRPAGQQGFLLLAADDQVGDLVLGYSDTDSFDPANIPTSMQWLLAAYAEYVAEAKAAPKAKRAPKEGRSDVAPLVQAQWNQYGPYNNNCPVINGSHCVTGCVATAMAQIMRYHKYPEWGIGSYTHTFTYGDAQYTTTADFGATEYKWDDMPYTYGGGSTQKQNEAVATLMHHCGVACKMDYTPGSSGSNPIFAGQGLLNYFSYDRSMAYYKRDWFTEDEWDELIYQQMAAGLPVMYEGYTANYGGHEFVCDGYRAKDGFYHINWGWGGSSNGYFQLAGLTPGQTGAGALNASGGFNFEQSALCNIKPDEGSDLTVTFYLLGGLDTDKTIYPKVQNSSVLLIGAALSASLETVEVEVALEYTGTVNGYIPLGLQEIEPLYGFGGLQVSASMFPVGEYDLRYVFRTEGEETWHPVYHNLAYSDCLHVISTEDQVILPYKEDEKEAKPECFFEKMTPVNSSDKEFYPGHSYDFHYTIKADDKWEGQMALVVVDKDMNEQATSKAKKISLDDKTAATPAFRLTLPEEMEAGEYYYALAIVGEKENEIYTDLQPLRVVQPLSEDAFALTIYRLYVDRGYLPAEVTNNKLQATTEPAAGRYALLDVPGKTNEFYLYCVDNQQFIQSTNFSGTNAFRATPDGTFTKSAIGTTGRFTIASKKTGNYLQFGGAKQLLIDGWKTLDAGNQWTIEEVGQFDATEVYGKLGWEVPGSEDGIGQLTIEQLTNGQLTNGKCFDLQGRPVATPRHGLYIIGRRKVLVK